MKILNKIINIFLITVLLMVSFFSPFYKVKAKTIADMKKELDERQAVYDEALAQKNLTESERKEIKNKIAKNEEKVVELLNENEKLNEEISELNKSIEDKYQEIKRIINTNQLMNGESKYLEYIFGAQNFTDFIFRASVAEQLSKYNKELTEQMEKDIKAREEKQKEIAKMQDEISAIQQDLKAQYARLGETLSALVEEMTSELDDIKLLKNNIAELQNTYNCSDDEDIEECKERARRATYIPPSTGAFKRPLAYGWITSEYGYYAPFGYTMWHAAMDMSGPSGSYVYASAPGRVVATFIEDCGNHIVYIAHNVNGTRYTTGYWHMRTYYVSVGDLVSENTVIGIMGGGRWEDTCSTGEHLDFVFTLGAYKTDYFVNPRTVSVNPRYYLSFPEKYYDWTTR